jgi:riboflavin kinase / FMN adenylyltransferase
LEIIPFDKELKLPYRPVMTIGMFDGVHIGHQRLLSILKNKAKEYNTKPIVITFDKHPQLVLKPEYLNDKLRLLQTNEERFEKLNSLGIENIITIHFTKEFASLSAKEFIDLLIEKYSPQYLLLGYDNHFGKKTSEEFDKLIAHSKQKGLILERTNDCIFYKDIEVSSTQIRKALAQGNVSLAQAMLNQSYEISGEVEQGNKIGRTLGFPTANIKIDKYKLLPHYGVYATEIKVEDKVYKGITNIGNRPTIKSSPITVEVNLFDYTGNLYGKRIKLSLKEYIRDEKKFQDLETLKAQIIIDIEKAKQILSTNE